MKKKLFAIAAGLFILGVGSSASADTYNISVDNYQALEHSYATSYGIDLTTIGDDEITSASITFNVTDLSSIYTLYISMFDDYLNKNAAYEGSDATGDYWSTKSGYTLLETLTSSSGSLAIGSYTLNFSTEEVAALNTLLDGGDYTLSLGFDADCHVTVTNIKFNITTDSTTPPTNEVPEPATMVLFGAGLAGIAGVRRSRKK